ncbi:MauE/DoxX family redox-associated membrane protein [Streptomyces flaveolus]|uniref:MauE/DoxX family redox-associated membrane protein n=1 Tax=Streptomyces flaveolus TaxID=67297 RepID=UPI0036F9378D
MLETLTEVGRGLFAAVFTVAAAGKSRPRVFTDLSASLAPYGLTGRALSRLVATTLIAAEATVAAALLLGHVSAGLGLAALLLAVLAGGVLVSMRRQLNVRCACFGSTGETLGRRQLWRNITLGALALILALAPSGPTPLGPAERLLLMATGVSLGVAIVVHDSVTSAITTRNL